MARITRIKCDLCGKDHEDAFVITHAVKVVHTSKPDTTPQTAIEPGDYCRVCLVRKFTSLIPDKIAFRSP